MNERIKDFCDQVGLDFENFQRVTVTKGDMEKFAELIVQDYAKQLVQANMSNREYAQAMDEHYEQKWAHRFD